MGTLRIAGKISLGQFWPKGASGNSQGSDADTIKVVVDKSRVLFNGKASTALGSAYAIDKGKKKLVINTKGEINVRLQGVDAPELHYPTTISKKIAKAPNGHFRQAWGESAAKALAAFLKKKFGDGPLTCDVISQNIGKPKDVCDSHGRVVGNVVINGVDVNLWLLNNGWAFPTFYNSMLKDEIEEATSLAKQAKAKNLGIWKDYQAIAFFDAKMLFNRADTGKSDKGAVLLPKLFRRCAASYVTHGSLQKLLPDIRASKSDRFVRTSDYLKGGSVFKQWGDAQNGAVRAAAASKVKLALAPWEFVMKEEPSTLYRDVNGQRREITAF